MRIRGIAVVAGLGLALGTVAPASAEHLETLGADVVGAIPGVGISEAVEEVFENLGLEDEEGEFVTTDATPFNPIDEGSVTTVFVDDVVFASEVVETEE